MVHHEVEADVLERVPQRRRRARVGPRLAGKVRPKIENGNLDGPDRHRIIVTGSACPELPRVRHDRRGVAPLFTLPDTMFAMRSVCPHDCPSACALDVTVSDGRLTSVTGDAAHPFTQGVICGKVRAYAERVHGSLRVLEPLRRVGPKGTGDFAPIGWDEAFDEIEQRWRGIIARHGAEAILPFSYAGTMGRIQYYAGHPLFHALGATRLDRT